MKRHRIALASNAGILFAVVMSLGMTQYVGGNIAIAASDPCSTPVGNLLSPLASGTTSNWKIVHGGGNVFYLETLPRPAVDFTGFAADTPGWFGFIRGTRMFLGFVHIFQHPTYQHLCGDGLILLATVQGHHYRDDGHTQGQLDGTLVGSSITITLVVHGIRYWIYGPFLPLPIPRHRTGSRSLTTAPWCC